MSNMKVNITKYKYSIYNDKNIMFYYTRIYSSITIKLNKY